ncbi:MAG: tetratricopeptide repeat protein [Sedimentisphaerales bacterium]
MNNVLTEHRSFLICVILSFATAAVYYQVCTYDFVNYDDNVYVYKNPNIQAGITLKSIKWAFTTDYSHMYHPITWLSLMLDWQLFGNNGGGYHFINLVVHIANTLLLFIVLKQMTRAIWPSALAAALFALHPLHVESVAWVTERKDVLSTFFWLLTMWAYVRYVSRPRITSYLLVVIFFVLGLMSKPMLVTLPFVLLLLDYWPLERLGLKHMADVSKQPLLYLLIEKIPLFAVVIASCIVTFIVQKKGGAMTTGKNYGFLVRLANASISYMQYIIKMIWPTMLAVFYPHPGRNVSFIYAGISAILLLAVTILVLRFAKSRRYLVTGWFWYVGTLVPVIGFVQVGDQAMADRYTYITLTGLFIIVAWGLPELAGKWPHRKIVLWVSSLVVLSVLAIFAHIQQGYWKDSMTLFQHALKVTNNNFVAHTSMGDALYEQGNIEKAIWHYTEAIRTAPDHININAINGLGLSFYKAGRIDEAIDCYKRAIEINPRTVEVHINLGVALAVAGKLAEAAKEYEKVLFVQPQNAIAHNNLGSVLRRQGKFDQAIEHFNQAIRIAPNFTTARDNLKIALAEKQELQNKNTENTKK